MLAQSILLQAIHLWWNALNTSNPNGKNPFKRKDYIKKFKTLTDNIISRKESLRFIKTVQNLKKLKKGQLTKLNIEVSKKYLKKNNKIGIF